MGELVRVDTNANVGAYRASTDAAEMCREIVVATATKISGKSYVCVEGWQAIALAHGCATSADQVERVTDEGMTGFKAIGIVRRMSDGAEISRAEGFLGDDEGTWAKRPVYARRAMVQTRAISRACRSAFAHVVVMMKANLSTTPAEEVPYGGFSDAPAQDESSILNPKPEEARPPAKKLQGKHKTQKALREAAGDIRIEIENATKDQVEEDENGNTIIIPLPPETKLERLEEVKTKWREDIHQIMEEGPKSWTDNPDWGLDALFVKAREMIEQGAA
jgi:hypothetical protein